MKKEINKSTLFAGGFTALVIVVALLFAFGTFDSSSTIVDNEGNGEVLSGRIVEMNPNRLMAGAPCHVMGGQAAGDCQTREINFEAWQYDWSEPTITVKTGELVRIIGTSKDVAHGIAIPAANFNLVLEPGKTSVGEFIAPTPGTYDYGCSVNCGSGHHNHRGKLVVVA